MRNDKENLIVKLSLQFSLNIIEYSESLRGIKKFEMASQIFRSGTSIGANIREAKMLKVKQILFINLKFLLKKLMN